MNGPGTNAPFERRTSEPVAGHRRGDSHRPAARLPARAPNCHRESRRDMSVGIRTVVSAVVSRARSSVRECLCDRVCGRVCPGGVYVVNPYAVRVAIYTSLDSVRRAAV